MLMDIIYLVTMDMVWRWEAGTDLLGKLAAVLHCRPGWMWSGRESRVL